MVVSTHGLVDLFCLEHHSIGRLSIWLCLWPNGGLSLAKAWHSRSPEPSFLGEGLRFWWGWGRDRGSYLAMDAMIESAECHLRCHQFINVCFWHECITSKLVWIADTIPFHHPALHRPFQWHCRWMKLITTWLLSFSQTFSGANHLFFSCLFASLASLPSLKLT